LAGKTKEQIGQEKKILELLSQYRSSGGGSMESERQKVFARLVEAVCRWCQYSSIFTPGRKKIEEAAEAGVEIFIAVRACVDKPYGGAEFFSVLKRAIKNEKIHSYYKEEAAFPKYLEKKIAYIKKFVAMSEESENRMMSQNEKIKFVSRFLNISEAKAAEYFEIDNRRNKVENISIYDDGKEGDVFDTIESPDYTSSGGSEDEELAKNVRFIQQVIESVVNKKPKTRECLKELFTLRYVDVLIELTESGGSLSFVSDEIIRARKNNEKLPTQYQIWQKHHPKAAKPSAEKLASEALAKLEKSLRIELRKIKEKVHPVHAVG
jgi:hypothetical protein